MLIIIHIRIRGIRGLLAILQHPTGFLRCSSGPAAGRGSLVQKEVEAGPQPGQLQGPQGPDDDDSNVESTPRSGKRDRIGDGVRAGSWYCCTESGDWGCYEVGSMLSLVQRCRTNSAPFPLSCVLEPEVSLSSSYLTSTAALRWFAPVFCLGYLAESLRAVVRRSRVLAFWVWVCAVGSCPTPKASWQKQGP